MHEHLFEQAPEVPRVYRPTPLALTQPEKLVASALRVDGKLYWGESHSVVMYREIPPELLVPVERGLVPVEDGFLTSHGAFVSRSQGYAIAEREGQLKEQANPDRLESEQVRFYH